MRPWTLALVATLAAGCSGGADTSSASADGECGDLDGGGTDTGDLPNILGNWTSTFANQIDFETCGITGLKPEDMNWIDGGAFSIDGTPPSGLYAEFTQEEGERFYGIESSHGGVVFSGIHVEQGYELHVSFGGLLFSSGLTGNTEIRGHAFMGIDRDGDGAIDCGLQGDYTAFKSGS